MPDKFAATWVSHSSMSDFLQCPRAYFLKNVYKDPNTGHKVQIVSPALALGSAVHEVIEGLSETATDKRFSRSLIEQLEKVWKKHHGKRGGFLNQSQEDLYKEQGKDMLRMVMEHPGPLKKLAVKIKADLPQYWLSETDEIILCGKLDWLEYFPETDTVHIIDFKTSKSKDANSTLQLPIYNLLASNTQRRRVEKASYWFLRLEQSPEEQPLPDLKEAHEQILGIAKQIKLARKLERFPCSQETGCFACKPMEEILAGNAEFVGENDFRQDMYIVDSSIDEEKMASEIL
ncbi:MAG: PD-(D/E)XK nuclease family protein [Microgenomates group bacterium]